jgi:ribosome-binding factor A
MTSRRIQRVNEQLRRELTALLQREVKDPRIAHVVITHVDAAPNLSSAHVLVFGAIDEKGREETLTGLRAATPFLRGELGRRLRMRRIPDLAWEWDRALEHAQRIEQLLAEVQPSSMRPDEIGEVDGGE